MRVYQKKNIRWNGIVRLEEKMKTVIVYTSVHHGNTKKVVKKIAEECGVDLIDAAHQSKADISEYDRISLPSERRKGYAIEMLNLLLAVCREFGKKRVLLTCDKTNEASRKTIITNGEVLENEVPDDVGLSESGIIQRYWIAL